MVRLVGLVPGHLAVLNRSLIERRCGAIAAVQWLRLPEVVDACGPGTRRRLCGHEREVAGSAGRCAGQWSRLDDRQAQFGKFASA